MSISEATLTHSNCLSSRESSPNCINSMALEFLNCFFRSSSSAQQTRPKEGWRDTHLSTRVGNIVVFQVQDIIHLITSRMEIIGPPYKYTKYLHKVRKWDLITLRKSSSSTQNVLGYCNILFFIQEWVESYLGRKCKVYAMHVRYFVHENSHDWLLVKAMQHWITVTVSQGSQMLLESLAHHISQWRIHAGLDKPRTAFFLET